MKRINIFDIDGTLVNSMHRYRTTARGKIDLPFWIKNDTRKNILADSLMPLAEYYRKALKNVEIFNILATARACEKNDANYEFINGILGKPDLFIHRNGRTDMRGGAQLKLDGIIPLFAQERFKGAEIHVYEDNSDYLRDVTQGLKQFSHKTVGHFNPSEQGH